MENIITSQQRKKWNKLLAEESFLNQLFSPTTCMAQGKDLLITFKVKKIKVFVFKQSLRYKPFLKTYIIDQMVNIMCTVGYTGT